MEENNNGAQLLPKLLDERGVLLAEHWVLGEAMEWGFDNEQTPKDAMNYIFGVYDLTTRLLREINGR